MPGPLEGEETLYGVHRFDTDTLADLTVIPGNQVALTSVVSYGLFFDAGLETLASSLRRYRRARSRQRILTELTMEITRTNNLPQPMVAVVDEAETLVDSIDDNRSGTYCAGTYRFSTALITLCNLDPRYGSTRQWSDMLGIYCHELGHHLDYLYWDDTHHTEAFHRRIVDLFASLLGLPVQLLLSVALPSQRWSWSDQLRGVRRKLRRSTARDGRECTAP